MTDAALGAEIEVPTIDGGKSKVKIPAGTQSGKQFRLKGKGMPIIRSDDYGDLYLENQIDHYNESLQPLRSFVLPSGTPAAALMAIKQI